MRQRHLLIHLVRSCHDLPVKASPCHQPHRWPHVLPLSAQPSNALTFPAMPLPWASVCCEGAIHEGGAVLEYIFEAHAAAEELLRSTGAGSADVRSPYTVPTWSASMNPTPPRQNKSLEDVLFAARTRTAETSRWLVDLLLAGCESSPHAAAPRLSLIVREHCGVLAQQPPEAPGSSGSLRPFERLILKLNSADSPHRPRAPCPRRCWSCLRSGGSARRHRRRR